MDLLSLLSILPDGLSDIELVQSRVPIKDVLACKVVLLGTSLAYLDEKKRLKSLVPIREHMQHFHPPVSSHIQPLQKYFHTLLDLYQKYRGSHQMASGINQINLNFGNLNQILLHGLNSHNQDVADAIRCTLSLCMFSRLTGRGWLTLMDHVPTVLPQPSDHKLEAEYITEVLFSTRTTPIENPDLLVAQAVIHFHYLNDPVLECEWSSPSLHTFPDSFVQRSVLSFSRLPS
jgi:hypothetical protein